MYTPSDGESQVKRSMYSNQLNGLCSVAIKTRHLFKTKDILHSRGTYIRYTQVSSHTIAL